MKNHLYIDPDDCSSFEILLEQLYLYIHSCSSRRLTVDGILTLDDKLEHVLGCSRILFTDFPDLILALCTANQSDILRKSITIPSHLQLFCEIYLGLWDTTYTVDAFTEAVLLYCDKANFYTGYANTILRLPSELSRLLDLDYCHINNLPQRLWLALS